MSELATRILTALQEGSGINASVGSVGEEENGKKGIFLSTTEIEVQGITPAKVLEVLASAEGLPQVHPQGKVTEGGPVMLSTFEKTSHTSFDRVLIQIYP